MKRNFGTVEVDTALPGQGAGPYLYFHCTATGRNGELWGDVAAAVQAELFRLSEFESQSLLRAAGDMLGGDVGNAMLAQLRTLAEKRTREKALRSTRPR